MDAFTIASWPVGSRATLHRVAWDSNYRDVVRFEDEAERETYFNSLDGDSIEIDKMTYLKPNQPIRINIPFSACYNYNYIVVENPELPVPGEITPPKLFYFINGVAFDAPNTSIINVQLDVFQTYLFDFELGWCFVERGHAPMSFMNEYTTWEDGKPRFSWSDARRLLLTPEGLDIGNEYVINWSNWKDLTFQYKIDPETGDYDRTKEGWAIMVMSTTDLESSWGDENHPNLDTSKSIVVDGLVSGCNILLFWESADYFDFAEQIYKHPWISSGIISITAIPRIFIADSYKDGKMLKAGYNGSQVDGVYKPPDTPDIETEFYSLSYDFKDAIYNSLPDKCRHFLKLYTFPYSVIELSAKNGSNLLLKPELFNTDAVELKAKTCITPGNVRMGIYPSKYGLRTNFDDFEHGYYTPASGYQKDERDKGYTIDCAIWFDNFPQFSITNDNYLMYLAGTVHTREYNYQAAGWQQARSSMQLQREYSNFGMRQNNQLQNFQLQKAMAITGGATGAIGSLLSGNIPGAIGGVINTGVNVWGSSQQFQNNLITEGTINNENFNLANQIIEGDYNNAIAAIDATVQDAALTQPSASGANGGNGFNASNGFFGYDIRFKMPNTRAIFNLCYYWGRYGYAYHQYWKPPKNLKYMKYFTYWKLKDTYITSAKADEGSKNIIRAMFERGVTVWNKPEEIGQISPLDNWESLEV